MTSSPRNINSSMPNRSMETRQSDYEIAPTPMFVIKTKRIASGEKVFINVCEHGDVPSLEMGRLGM